MRERPLVIAADDNSADLILIERIFERAGGFDLRTVRTGEEALNAALELQPDVMLLDVYLPVFDGYEICRRVRAHPQGKYIYIILVTALNQVKGRVQGLESGADDFLAKPYHAHELMARVRAGLRVRNLQDELLEKNRQLQDLHAQLVQNEKMASVGLLAAGVAHEFNNVMTSIYGFAQLSRRDGSYKDKLVDVALTDVKRALRITESLLSFGRRQPDVRKDSHIAKLLDEIIVLVEAEFRQNNVELVRQYAEQMPEILVNRGHVQQVFLNLLRNAGQSIMGTGHGGLITLRVFVDGDKVVIEVQDNGPGIPVENREKIFEPFFTTKGALGGSQIPGTGLGLFVSRNLIDKHGGSLTVHSEPPQGATFRVELPIIKDRRKLDSDVEGDRRIASMVKRKLRILVCDDEVPVRNLLSGFLAVHQVKTASGGQEAVDAVRAEGFDYVFMDIKMPGKLDGYAAFDEILKLDPQAKIIFITGAMPDEKMEEYFKRAYAYIHKPFDLADVIGILK